MLQAEKMSIIAALPLQGFPRERKGDHITCFPRRDKSALLEISFFPRRDKSTLLEISFFPRRDKSTSLQANIVDDYSATRTKRTENPL